MTGTQSLRVVGQPPHQRLRLLTFEDKGGWQSAFLTLSARKHGLEVERVTTNETGFAWGAKMDIKIKQVRDFVAMNVPDEDVVLFADAYDVIIVADEEEILEKFRRLETMYPGKGVFFNAEDICLPSGIHCDLERDAAGISGRRNPFLNSGVFIGRGRAVRRMFELASPIPENLQYDQEWYHEQLVGRPGKEVMGLDIDQVIAKAAFTHERESGGEYSFQSGRIHDNIYDTFPAVLHFNGPAHWKVPRHSMKRYEFGESRSASGLFRMIRAKASDNLRDPVETTYLFESFKKLFPEEGSFLEPFGYLQPLQMAKTCSDCFWRTKQPSSVFCDSLRETCKNLGKVTYHEMGGDSLTR